MSSSASQDNVETLKDYDEVPYPGSAFPSSHPSHIAAVARVCGLTPPAPDKCRVLELGSSVGSNLIPMAESLAESQFVGIDLSAGQVATGQAVLDELALKNVELRHLNIADVDDSLGKFDYIICHGVYSWVPHDVQEKILQIGRDLLSENGIMYVSYNTYPGWHLRDAVRNMMRYHAANFKTPKEKIHQSRELLKFLADSAKTQFEAYPKLLEQEVKSLSKRTDGYLYHEFLESVNEPLYFHEFIDRVQSSGLRYVADAEIRTMMSQFFDQDVSKLLRDIPMLRREQYMDFLRSRMFRVSLLCKSNTSPRYDVTADCLSPMHVRLKLPLRSKKEDDGKIVWTYPQGTMKTSSPMSDVLKLLSARWPDWVSVQELIEGPLKEEAKNQEKYLRDLMAAMLQGILMFADSPPSLKAEISEKPLCTPYARWQAKKGDTVTNRLHTDLKCQRITSLVLEHSDGKHSESDLVDMLKSAATDGQFAVTHDDEEVDDPAFVDWKPVLRQELVRLATAGLFVG